MSGYLMGIDGGGSTLRIIITAPDLSTLAYVEGGAANPGAIGRDTAATLLQAQIQEALAQAGLAAAHIAGVGVGIAGASARHSAGWLESVLRPALPNARLALSSDVEIALVGAHGKREGLLLLAGTGSVAYGVNRDGESAQVGGWGYLLGDEGGGFWLGLEALRAVTLAADGRAPTTALSPVILDHLGLTTAYDLIAWVYQAGDSGAARLASLAPLVIAQAEHDPIAAGIVERGVAALSAHEDALRHRLHMPDARIAFAGGLLTPPTDYGRRLCARLGLDSYPVSQHPPVMGAVLLAAEQLMRQSD